MSVRSRNQIVEPLLKDGSTSTFILRRSERFACLSSEDIYRALIEICPGYRDIVGKSEDRIQLRHSVGPLFGVYDIRRGKTVFMRKYRHTLNCSINSRCLRVKNSTYEIVSAARMAEARYRWDALMSEMQNVKNKNGYCLRPFTSFAQIRENQEEALYTPGRKNSNYAKLSSTEFYKIRDYWVHCRLCTDLDLIMVPKGVSFAIHFEDNELYRICPALECLDGDAAEALFSRLTRALKKLGRLPNNFSHRTFIDNLCGMTITELPE